MKNLFSNFISLFFFLFLVLPFFVFGEAATDQDIQDFLKNSKNSTSTASASSSMSTKDLLDAFLKDPNVEFEYVYNPNLSEEDNFILQRKPGESAADYIQRINTENSIRKALNQPLLPDPTISTTQVPKTPEQPALQGKAPPIPTNTSTNQRTRVDLSGDTLLDQLVPRSTFTDGQGGGLSGILNQLFYAGLVIAVILAIVMIIRGGVEYMTIDAGSSKEAAKNRIKAAIGGLVLCFSTVIILQTINPNLVSLNLQFDKIMNLNSVDVTGLTKLTSEARQAREAWENSFTGPPAPGSPGVNTAGPIPTSYFGGPADVRTKDGYALHYCNQSTYGGRIGDFVESTLGGAYRWCWALDANGNKISYPEGSSSAHGGFFEPTAFSDQSGRPFMKELSGDYIAYPLNNTASSRITGLPSVSSNTELRGKSVQLTLQDGTVLTAAIRDRGPYGSIGKLDVSPALSLKINAGGGLKSVTLAN